ncbi:MAG: lipopolysaccharide biosynthesis protein [Deferribacterales bacterium]
MRFLKNLMYSYFAIVVGFVSSIVSVPVIISQFGNELFSFWSMVFGISLYITTASFGVPSAANVAVAGLNTTEAVKRSIRSAFIFLVIIAAGLAICGLAYIIIDPDWIHLFGNMSGGNIPVLKASAIILILLSLIRLPFTLFQQLFIAFNLVYVERSYQMLLAGLILLMYLLTYVFHVSFLSFAVMVGAAGVITSLAACYHLLKYIGAMPKNPYVYEEHVTLKDIVRQSVPFFQIGIAQAITWNCGTFVISHMMDAATAAPFVVAMKFVIFAVYTFLIVNNIFFPLYSRAYAAGDMATVNRFYGYALSFLPAAGGLIWIGALFFYKDIAIIWTGSKEIYTGPLMMLFLGGFMYFLAFSNSHNILLQTIKASKISAWVTWTEASVCLAVSVLLVNLIGVEGPAAGVFTATFLTSVFILPKQIKSYTDGKVCFDYMIHLRHFVMVLAPCLLVGFFAADRLGLAMRILLFMFTCSVYMSLTAFILPKGTLSDIIQLKWKR